MIRRRSTALFVCAALLAPVPIAGCGGGGDERTIPQDDGARLVRLLRRAREAAGDPDRCDELKAAVSAARDQVAALPSRVDADTRRSLENGVTNLADHARQECEQATTTETTPTETTPTTTETAPPPTTTETAPPTTTETTPTEPTETEPTETEPTVTEPPTPPGPGQGNGGPPPGKGNGSGGAGPQDAPGQEKKHKPGKGPKSKKEKAGK